MKKSSVLMGLAAFGAAAAAQPAAAQQWGGVFDDPRGTAAATMPEGANCTDRNGNYGRLNTQGLCRVFDSRNDLPQSTPRYMPQYGSNCQSMYANKALSGLPPVTAYYLQQNCRLGEYRAQRLDQLHQQYGDNIPQNELRVLNQDIAREQAIINQGAYQMGAGREVNRTLQRWGYDLGRSLTGH